LKKPVNHPLNAFPSTSASPLRPVFLPGLYALIFLSPFFRGLFFEDDFLLALIMTSAVFIICLADHWRNVNINFFGDPLTLAVMALLLAYIISTITAVHRHDAIIELLKMGSYVMVFWMAARVGDIEGDFQKLLLAAYLAAMGMAIIGLSASLGLIHWPGAWEDGHIRSSLQYHNALAIYAAAMNLVGLAFSLQTKSIFPRWAFTAGNYLLFLVIIGSLSRGTWLLYPLAMGSLVFLIPGEYRRKALEEIAVFMLAGFLASRFIFNYLSHAQQLSAGVFMLLGLLLAIAASMIKESAWVSDQLAKRGVKPRSLAIIALIGIALMMINFIVHPASLTGFIKHVVPDTVVARTQKTSIQDNSFKDRLTTDLDSWKIIKDYPLTGTGGGGWKALYHSYASRLYWINDVHNAYLQTWVEAGILGFTALIAVILLLLRLIIKTWHIKRDNPDSILLWSTTVAVLLIAVHSSIDFELSIPAVAFLFFALTGLISGNIMAMQSNKAGRQNIAAKPLSGYVLIILAGILAISAGTIASCYYSANRIANKGVQVLESRQLQIATGLYQKAAKLDPYNGAYRVNLAQIAALRANSDKDSAAAGEALNHARKASECEPFNTSLRAAIFSIYGRLGRPDLQILEAEATIRANPFLSVPYEQMAGTVMPMAWQCLDTGQNEAAFLYFRRLLALRNKMPAETLNSTPDFNLAAGQSALLLGETALAKDYLALLLQSETRHSQTARLWLKGVDFMEAQKKSGANTNLNTLQMFLKQQKDQ